MKENFYLIVNENGVISTRKMKPSLTWNEIAIKVRLDIPEILFKRPHLEATITVDEKAVQPEQITPEVIINTKELIEQQTGAKIDFRVMEFKDSNKELRKE